MAGSPPVPTVTVIGSLNMDLVTYTPRVPAGGETLTASSFSTALGGKGANQAIACAKLSRSSASSSSSPPPLATVKMVGAVGSDAYGAQFREGMGAMGVDMSGVLTREGVSSGVATILVEEATGQNRILFTPGANYTLKPEQFETFSEPLPDLLILQLEIPVDTTLQIMAAARKQGVPLLFNPAPAQKIPEEYYSAIAHLVVNETEAALLAGCKESVLDTEAGLQKVAKDFQDKGAKTVLITLGGRGVFYLGEDGKKGLVPAEKVKVVDTTAAGDTFIGAYALEVVRPGFEIEKAVRKANRAAAWTVGRKGAQVSIPWADELEP